MLIRQVHKSDVNQLKDLYNRVWPDVTFEKLSKASFVVEHSDGVSYCAEDNGIIVGSRTSFYVNMYYGERLIRCVQFADSCIDSDYRGKGLFLKLNQAFLKDFFQNGELVYNISVYASKMAYEKMGWHYIESLMLLRKFSRPFHVLLKLKGDIRKLGGDIKWDFSYTEFTIPTEFLKVRERFLASNPLLHIQYNSEIIKWRQKSRNGMKCITDNEFGSIIFKVGNKNGLNVVEIGEMFLKKYDFVTFKKAQDYIKKVLKPDIIMVMISLGHPLLPFYEKWRFLKNPKQKFLHHGTRVETEEMRKIAENPLNWAISSLDIDTF